MMSVTPITRPPRSTPEQTERLAEEYEEKIRGDKGEANMDQRVRLRRTLEDPRVTSASVWVAGLFKGLVIIGISAAIALILSMRSDLAILLSRPPSVAKEQYDRDYDRLTDKVDKMDLRLTHMEDRQLDQIKNHP